MSEGRRPGIIVNPGRRARSARRPGHKALHPRPESRRDEIVVHPIGYRAIDYYTRLLNAILRFCSISLCVFVAFRFVFLQ